MTTALTTTLYACSLVVILGSSMVNADDGHSNYNASHSLLDIASAYLLDEPTDHFARGRSARSRYERGFARHTSNRNDSYGNRSHNDSFDNRHSGRHGYGESSYTSEPIRGGSSRRTRVIDNPYPNRPVTGLTFTGIEHEAVHVKDVISYPRKRLISPRGYSLSLHHPSRFIRTRGYIDYISVQAKRKEYFTVTFHYD